MSTAEHVERLLTTVGPRITAAGLGLADARPLAAYRRGDEPRQAIVVARAAVLVDVVDAVLAAGYDGAVAAAFLRGSNPDLDDAAALLLIRNAANPAALQAAADRIHDAVAAFVQGPG